MIDAEVVSLVHGTLTVSIHFILLRPWRIVVLRHNSCVLDWMIIVLVNCGEIALRINRQVQDVQSNPEASKVVSVLWIVHGFHVDRIVMFAGK